MCNSISIAILVINTNLYILLYKHLLVNHGLALHTTHFINNVGNEISFQLDPMCSVIGIRGGGGGMHVP